MDKYFWICGANSQEDYGEQPTINQNKNKNHQHSNPKLHNTSHKGYRKISWLCLLFFFFLFILVFPFMFFSFIFFLCFFSFFPAFFFFFFKWKEKYQKTYLQKLTTHDPNILEQPKFRRKLSPQYNQHAKPIKNFPKLPLNVLKWSPITWLKDREFVFWPKVYI